MDREHVIALMVVTGWRFDPSTEGFRRGKDWVTLGQAMEAIANAEAGIEAAPKLAASETVAKAIAAPANDAVWR